MEKRKSKLYEQRALQRLSDGQIVSPDDMRGIGAVTFERLATAGLIEKVPLAGHVTEIGYRITELGRAALAVWLAVIPAGVTAWLQPLVQDLAYAA